MEDQENQNNSSKEPYINLDGYHKNSQESKSFNATNLFVQEDEKKSQSKQ